MQTLQGCIRNNLPTMSTAKTTINRGGSVEASLADQEQTSPESLSNVTRPTSHPSSRWGQSNDERYVPTNRLAHYPSRRTPGMQNATSCTHASGRACLNTAGDSLNHEEIPTPSSAGLSVLATVVGTDHKTSWRARTMSSDYSESHQPKDVEASPETDGLDEARHPAPVSALNPIPDLYENLYEHAPTPYVKMLLAIDLIPNWYTLIAGFSTWILLAGFVLFPATFASWATRPTGTAEYEIAALMRDMPLLVIAWVCTGVGGAGMIWMWWKWRKNYLWVVSRVFVPGLLNSVAGIITTVTSAYETEGNLSGSSVRATIIVTGAVAVICGILVVIYQCVFIRRLRKEHNGMENERETRRRNARERKGEVVQVEVGAETLKPCKELV
ncbi:hypothetical protein EDC04DRAFT_318933 [Pisolithus marmoratus]|nr:hypothetical protein EDC04DRAFT_318933 [Pisolithus marmoratus]